MRDRRLACLIFTLLCDCGVVRVPSSLTPPAMLGEPIPGGQTEGHSGVHAGSGYDRALNESNPGTNGVFPDAGSVVGIEFPLWGPFSASFDTETRTEGDQYPQFWAARVGLRFRFPPRTSTGAVVGLGWNGLGTFLPGGGGTVGPDLEVGILHRRGWRPSVVCRVSAPHLSLIDRLWIYEHFSFALSPLLPGTGLHLDLRVTGWLAEYAHGRAYFAAGGIFSVGLIWRAVPPPPEALVPPKRRRAPPRRR